MNWFMDSPILVLLVIALVINLCATSAFAEIAHMKGHSNNAITVWVLGFFCSVVVAGLYVAALPDRAKIIPPNMPNTTYGGLPRM